jgi:hypothetical protein
VPFCFCDDDAPDDCYNNYFSLKLAYLEASIIKVVHAVVVYAVLSFSLVY